MEAQLRKETHKEEPLDWSDLVVVQPEHVPATERSSSPAPCTAAPSVSVAKAVATMESMKERTQKLKEHDEVLQLVGSQARLIEDLEADVETLRSALRSQSMEAAEHINKAALIASLDGPPTPPAARAGGVRGLKASHRALLHHRMLDNTAVTTDCGTDEEGSASSEGTESTPSMPSSRQSSIIYLAAGEGDKDESVVCARDFAHDLAASPQASPRKAAAIEASHASKCAVQPSAFAAAAAQPFTPPASQPQPIAVRPRPPRRQLSAADVASFGSMGLTFSIAPPSPHASDSAPSVASMDGDLDDAGSLVPRGAQDAGDEFLELVGCLGTPWRGNSAPLPGMSSGSYTPFHPASARPLQARHQRSASNDSASSSLGRDIAPDVLAQRLASYRSAKEGMGAHGSGSWQVPVVVRQRMESAAAEEADPLAGTLLGAVYKLFSG